MFLALLKPLAKRSLRFAVRSSGFIAAMLAGPGAVFLMYAFEPHRPVPDIADGLPGDLEDAAHVMQGRVERLLPADLPVASVRTRLAAQGFTVSPSRNHAVFRRRQLACIESYGVVWTEIDDRLLKAAALVQERCPGLASR